MLSEQSETSSRYQKRVYSNTLFLQINRLPKSVKQQIILQCLIKQLHVVPKIDTFNVSFVRLFVSDLLLFGESVQTGWPRGHIGVSCHSGVRGYTDCNDRHQHSTHGQGWQADIALDWSCRDVHLQHHDHTYTIAHSKYIGLYLTPPKAHQEGISVFHSKEAQTDSEAQFYPTFHLNLVTTSNMSI